MIFVTEVYGRTDYDLRANSLQLEKPAVNRNSKTLEPMRNHSQTKPVILTMLISAMSLRAGVMAGLVGALGYGKIVRAQSPWLVQVGIKVLY